MYKRSPEERKSTRELGVAISEMFRRGLVSYQGDLYEVFLVDTKGKRVRLNQEIYSRFREKIKMFNPELEKQLPSFPRREDYANEDEFNEAMEDLISVETPYTVACKLGENFEWFWCQSCGTLIPVSSGIISSDRRCPTCSGELFQAPILVYKEKWSPSFATKMPPRYILPIKSRPCDKCSRQRKKKIYKNLKSLYPVSPLSDLRIYCPSHETPESPTAQKVLQRHYKPAIPSSHIIRPIGATVCETYGQEKGLDFEILNSQFIEAVTYYQQIRVYQVVFGYAHTECGHQHLLEKFSGRKFITQAIEVKLQPGSFLQIYNHVTQSLYNKELAEEFTRDLRSLGDNFFLPGQGKEREEYQANQIKRWVLHSLAHVMVIVLPLITGLEPAKFNYSYDVQENRVVIFDNEPGGAGGVQLIAENAETLWFDYLNLVQRQIQECDCRSRCLRCLALQACGEINNALNRHLVGPIMNVETDYD